MIEDIKALNLQENDTLYISKDGNLNNVPSTSDNLLLKQLFNLMDTKMTFTTTPSDEDKELIKKVMELI